MSCAAKATPTEFKGIRFRSKSEAIFAFHLEKTGWHWNYESHAGAVIHPWDFELTSYSKNERTGTETRETYLIEYKPSKPTETYIQNLKEKIHLHFNERWQAIRSEESLDNALKKDRFFLRHLETRFFLVYGSPYKPAFESELIEAAEILFELFCNNIVAELTEDKKDVAFYGANNQIDDDLLTLVQPKKHAIKRLIEFDRLGKEHEAYTVAFMDKSTIYRLVDLDLEESKPGWWNIANLLGITDKITKEAMSHRFDLA